MINALIALPYKLARTPLSLVDSTLSHRLPETSLPRTTLDLVIGSTDRLAGALLGDDELGRRGVERVERSDTLRKAGKLEHQADARRKQAEQTFAEARQEADLKRQAAEEHATESLDLADVVEAREKREAKANAKKAAAAKKRAADEEAERRKSAVEQREQTTKSAAETNKKAAQREAEARMDKARSAEKSAAASRADAERLENLVDAKKQERKKN